MTALVILKLIAIGAVALWLELSGVDATGMFTQCSYSEVEHTECVSDDSERSLDR